MLQMTTCLEPVIAGRLNAAGSLFDGTASLSILAMSEFTVATSVVIMMIRTLTGSLMYQHVVFGFDVFENVSN